MVQKCDAEQGKTVWRPNEMGAEVLHKHVSNTQWSDPVRLKNITGAEFVNIPLDNYAIQKIMFLISSVLVTLPG